MFSATWVGGRLARQRKSRADLLRTLAKYAGHLLSNQGRAFTNSALLWARIAGVTLAKLLTTSFLLSAFGVEGFGVFVTVSSTALLTGFITSAMQATSLRAIALETGGVDAERRLFSSLLGMHLWLSIGLLLLGLTLGTWAVDHVLSVPTSMEASARAAFLAFLWASVSGSFFAPFEAYFQSKERFGLFTFIELARSWLLVPISYWMVFYNGDRIATYALASSGLITSGLVIASSVSAYAYPATRPIIRHFFAFRTHFSHGSIFSWSLFGAIATVGRNQGLVVLLNVLGGPTASAAFAIGKQISGAVRQFSDSLRVVLIPRIYGREASGNRSGMISQMILACRVSTLVATALSLPLIFELPTILNIWLGQAEGLIIFVTTLLISNELVDQSSRGAGIASMAMGNIGRFQFVVGSLSLLALPIAFLVGRSTGDFRDALWVFFGSTITVVITRIAILEPLAPGVMRDWMNDTLLRLIGVAVPVIAILALVLHLLAPSLLRMGLTVSLSTVTCAFLTYWVGMKQEERYKLRAHFQNVWLHRL